MYISHVSSLYLGISAQRNVFNIFAQFKIINFFLLNSLPPTWL